MKGTKNCLVTWDVFIYMDLFSVNSPHFQRLELVSSFELIQLEASQITSYLSKQLYFVAMVCVSI